jgi:hypothetical protein
VPTLLARYERSVLYESSNGDVWSLARHPASSTPVVKHQPNASSAGRTSYTEIGKFPRDRTVSGSGNAAY